MTNIEIKEVTIDDVMPLQKISRQTFSETFAAVNTEENMTKYLEKELSIVEFDKHIFRLGEDEQTDIMMKLKLTYRSYDQWDK